MNFIDIVLLGLFSFFVYCDLSVLLKQNRDLFYEKFRLPGWVYLFLGLVLISFFFDSPARKHIIILLCVTGFALYTVKRIKFKKAMKISYSSAGDIDRSLFLASDAFGVLFLWISGMLGVSLMLRALWYFLPQFESKLGELVIVSAFSSVLFVYLIFRTVKKYPDLDFIGIIGLRKNNLPVKTLVVIPALLGLLFAGLSSYLIMSREYQPMTPLGETIEQTASSIVFYSFIFVAVLLAPFFEEVIFRGYFFYVLDKIKGRALTVVVIGSMFGFLHFDQYWGDWLAIAVVTMLGFILTLLRSWNETIIPSVVMHYVYNGAMTIIPIIVVVLSNPVFFEYQINYHKLDSPGRETLLQKSIKQYPDHAPSYNDLAWLYAQEERNLEEALLLIDTALSYDGQEYAYLDTKAEVLYKMGRTQEAIGIAEDLLNMYPEDDYIKRQLEKFRIKDFRQTNDIE